MRQQVVTHHLEMTDPSQLVPARKSAPTFSLCQAEIPCPALNRFLYTAVGGDWYWTQRLAWSYAQWQTYLAQAGVETWVAYVAGTPAGYFELETQAEGNIEIAYFGLLPPFIGHGLDLLSAPLTIPLVCCHINSFRRASSWGEAMTRRRKEERRAGLASRGM
jgi:hypothetical protein